jgi:capsular polysaccharide biosynthesis protein
LGVPLLVRNDIPEFARNLISRVSKRATLPIYKDSKYQVEKLYIVPGRSSVYDSSKDNSFKRVDFPKLSLLELRSRLSRSGQKIDSANHKRIAILRNQGLRKVSNLEELLPALQNNGFEIITPSKKFYSKQDETFQNANIVVASGGAVLANMLFMNPESTVIALVNRETSKIGIWRDLANVFDLNYVEIVGRSGFLEKTMEPLHRDYAIAPKKLRRTLSWVTQSITY